MLILATGVWGAAAALLIWKRSALKWWLLTALALVLMPFGPLIFGIVALIGFLKFAIGAAGKGEELAGGRMRQPSAEAAPRGLVNYEERA